MKSCLKCGRILALENFRRRSDVPDGHRNECRDCSRAKDHFREQRPARREWRRSYQRRYVGRNPEKHRAHFLVWCAVKDGRLERLPCAICGAKRVDAHHTDYSKPLDVVWLCRDHHRMVHTAALPV